MHKIRIALTRVKLKMICCSSYIRVFLIVACINVRFCMYRSFESLKME